MSGRIGEPKFQSRRLAGLTLGRPSLLSTTIIDGIAGKSIQKYAQRTVFGPKPLWDKGLEFSELFSGSATKEVTICTLVYRLTLVQRYTLVLGDADFSWTF